MLRILIWGLVVFLGVAPAAAVAQGELEQAEEDAVESRALFEAALRDVDEEDINALAENLEDSTTRAESIPEGMFPNLSAELTDRETLATIGELMANAETLAAELGVSNSADEGLAVYVFASFSMPEASLRAVIEQGELAGAAVVLRGLVNNSVEDTMLAVRSMYGDDERPESGAVIDPTLFERFAVSQVPTVVVAAIAAEACSPEGCPTPDHVKLSGDVPLRYALERIGQARPAFQSDLSHLITRLEPERTW